MPRTHRPAAFTLIELLVVITIIVVLLAILTPALDKAIEAAERAVCGAQLHVFGAGVPQYAMDNKRAYHSTVSWRSSPTADPNAKYPHPLMVRPFRDAMPGEWNVEGIAPYVGGVVELTKTDATQGGMRRVLKEPWYCPSNAADKTLANNNVSNSGELNGLMGDPYFDVDYSYLGRVESWNRNHATRPQELAGRQLGSGKVLMADTLFFYAPTGTQSWWLNHSQNGYSVHNAGFGGPVLYGREQLDKITGINKLYGDGSAVWKSRGEFDYERLKNLDLNQPWVSNVGGGNTNEPNQAGSITFY